jgi:hypothetical protein
MCEERKAFIKQRYAQKLADIASGKLTLDLKFSGPLSELPTELRLMIFRDATRHECGLVTVRPGYLSS